MKSGQTRRAKRLPLQIPIKVESRDRIDSILCDVTRLESVSQYGAGFVLERAFGVGTLVKLTIPMPLKLRAFDHFETQYRIWGIVRYCNVGPSGNQIGVAFIGKDPPRSYLADPSLRYKIDGVGSDDFWRVSQSADGEKPKPRQPRYSIPIDVSLAIFNEGGSIIAHERTVTENISSGGAAVFSSLPLKIGDRIRVFSQHANVSLDAEVRNVRMGADGLPRAHLQFVDTIFPLEGIEQAF